MNYQNAIRTRHIKLSFKILQVYAHIKNGLYSYFYSDSNVTFEYTAGIKDKIIRNLYFVPSIYASVEVLRYLTPSTSVKFSLLTMYFRMNYRLNILKVFVKSWELVKRINGGITFKIGSRKQVCLLLLLITIYYYMTNNFANYIKKYGFVLKIIVASNDTLLTNISR